MICFKNARGDRPKNVWLAENWKANPVTRRSLCKSACLDEFRGSTPAHGDSATARARTFFLTAAHIAISLKLSTTESQMLDLSPLND
jgi:hypothetical protein